MKFEDNKHGALKISLTHKLSPSEVQDMSMTPPVGTVRVEIRNGVLTEVMFTFHVRTDILSPLSDSPFKTCTESIKITN